MTQKKTKRQKVKQPLIVHFSDDTKVHPALREFFGYCMFKVAARLRYIMDKALEPHDLQSHHLGVMKVLKVAGPMSQIELGDVLGFDKASMVKLIDHLEKHKFVVRQTDPKDRRVKNVQVTAKGISETEMCVKLKHQVEKEFFGNTPKEDQEFLRKLIPKLLP
jgi:DNA-binding MarR family transcriptional regulator